MSIAHDDARLTAYALAELGPEETHALEAALAGDARAQGELASIRETSALLERELSGSKRSPTLSARRRGSLKAAFAAKRETEIDPETLPFVPRRRRASVWLAALLPAAALGLVWLLDRSDRRQDRLRLVEGQNLAGSELAGSELAGSELAGSELAANDRRELPSQHEPLPMAPVQPPEQPNWRAAPPVLDLMADGRYDEEREAAPMAHALAAKSLAARSQDGTIPLGAMTGHGRLATASGVRPSVEASRVPGVIVPPLPNSVPLQAWGDVQAWGNEVAEPSHESYDTIDDNPFVSVAKDPRSTFSIDVDTAGYALLRRFIGSGQLPPRGAVRIEELINYFSYRYPQPSGDAPFALLANVAQAPWNSAHQLVRVALQARHVAASARPPANLVFLIDVSGSMAEPNKLGLVQYGLRQLTATLGASDRVSIVTYAGNSGMVLAPTAGNRRDTILQAIDRLEAGGSTNGGAGIELAYSLARQHFARGNVNRVLLATDGDFNVGVTSQSELVELVQREAKSGVFLSVLGFGDGNYQDSMLEKLADKGNGNYAYIDERAEAKKVLVEQATGMLLTLAKDVKLQLEFNPGEVSAFRLIGYENRMLEHPDFNDDTKDAGELGADHSVTALYELIPAGSPVPGSLDPLKFQPVPAPPAQTLAAFRGQLLQIKVRYQPPYGGPSQLLEQPLRGPAQGLDEDFRFAAAVAEFGLLLRESPHRGDASYAQVLKLAQSSLGDGRDRQAREQFVELVRKARRLSKVAN